VFSVTEIVTILLLPCVLSGFLISAIVLLLTKRRRLRRFISSRRVGQLTYKSV
jgi:hypothetical protein